MPIVREQAASVLGLNGSLILVGITPQPLTISEGLTFNHLSKQVRGHYVSGAGVPRTPAPTACGETRASEPCAGPKAPQPGRRGQCWGCG
ncbi:hypothetical protein [Streptomyces mirabilis]|uniref:hypothetical protein n=1 Tax=Streptomyces mirabilis TaxID=68239 RepID=UPI0036CA3D1D